MSMSTGPLNGALQAGQSSYNEALQTMTRALERLASNSRLVRASDDVGSFVNLISLDIERAAYERRKVGLNKASAELQMILDAVDSTMDDLKAMKIAWADAEAAAAGSPEKLLATAKAQGIAASVAVAVTQTYDGKKLIDSTSDFGSVIDAVGGTITLTRTLSGGSALPDGTEATAAETDTAIKGLSEYAGVITGLKVRVDSQANVAGVMIANTQSVAAALSSIDDAREMADVIDSDLRQQAALSILSQAHLSRYNIAVLYENEL